MDIRLSNLPIAFPGMAVRLESNDHHRVKKCKVVVKKGHRVHCLSTRRACVNVRNDREKTVLVLS